MVKKLSMLKILGMLKTNFGSADGLAYVVKSHF
jgi:hypothetical protein